MLILTSDGLSSKELIDEVGRCISNTDRKAALITTASVGYKEKDWKIPRLKKELESLGFSVDYFDIEFQSPSLLYNYDLIEIIGGNPFYLLKQMKDNKCESVFKQLNYDKIIIGISAGSVVLQNSIELIAEYSPEMNNGIDIKDLSGMKLTDLEILPHYHRLVNRFERFEERARQYEVKNNCSVIRIDDGQAVFITNESRYYVK